MRSAITVAVAFLAAGFSYQTLAQPSAAVDPPAPETSTPARAPDASPTAPAAPAAATSTATATASAGSPSAAAATADTEALDARVEKRLRTQGYKPYMQKGQKVFCKRETVLGSRLEGRLLCMTLDEARATENEAQNDIEHLQHLVKPCMPNGGGRGASCGN